MRTILLFIQYRCYIISLFIGLMVCSFIASDANRAGLVLQPPRTELNDPMLPRERDALVLAEPAPTVKHVRPGANQIKVS